MDFQGALAFLLALGSLEIHQAIPSHQAILSWSLKRASASIIDTSLKHIDL